MSRPNPSSFFVFTVFLPAAAYLAADRYGSCASFLGTQAPPTALLRRPALGRAPESLRQTVALKHILFDPKTLSSTHCPTWPWAEAAHPGAVRRPVALEQVLLKVVLVAGEHLCAAVGRRKGPHVPHAQRVVLHAEQRIDATGKPAQHHRAWQQDWLATWHPHKKGKPATWVEGVSRHR